ncbi:MAG: VWA domain-containing protein, partial [Deltaproteobacteria bacterium]|nr:VWA domain-containing protein [Deltaproteobacteria bacterium]
MISCNVRLLRNSLFCFLLFFTPVTNIYMAHAEQSLLYYILDGSGSMWGRVEGETKVAVAKATLTRLIQETPDGVNVGLCVYGLRRQGDCKDIEEIIPPGTLDRKKAAEGIEKIIPKGKTPLADSITYAAERIKANGFNTTLVLISDGLETCGKDPCAVTRALREGGLKFVMHVVGFGVGEEEKVQLSCIAKEGGGQLYQ